MSDPKPYELPPRNRDVVDVSGVRDGWYVVDVAFRANNPVHRTLMSVSARGAIAVIPSTSVEDPATRVGSLHYLRVVKAIDLGGAA